MQYRIVIPYRIICINSSVGLARTRKIKCTFYKISIQALMNVGYKHTPYNYKFCNCSWTVLHNQKVHFFIKSTAQQNFLATGLNFLARLCVLITSTVPAAGCIAISRASLSAICKLWAVVIALSRVRSFSARSL